MQPYVSVNLVFEQIYYVTLCTRSFLVCTVSFWEERRGDERRGGEDEDKGTIQSVCSHRGIIDSCLIWPATETGRTRTHHALDFTFNTLGSLQGLHPHLWPSVLQLCFLYFFCTKRSIKRELGMAGEVDLWLRFRFGLCYFSLTCTHLSRLRRPL